MPWNEIATGALALVTAVVAFFAYRLSAKANTAQANASKTVVDAEAYKRARELYESAITTVTDESDRLRREVASLHTEITSLRVEVGRLQDTNSQLRREVAELRSR